MTLLLSLLAQPALAGACGCGLDFYLARSAGDMSVEPEASDTCHEQAPDSIEPGSFHCVLLDPWNPHAEGQADAEQRAFVERVVTIGETYPTSDPGRVLNQAALWRMPESDPLHSRVEALALRGERSAPTWKAGKKATAHGAVHELVWSQRCGDPNGFRELYGTSYLQLNDVLLPPSEMDRATAREKISCGYGNALPSWAWVSLEGPLHPDGLWLFETEELAVVRNMPYARTGRPFTSEAMKKAFEEGQLRGRYRPDPSWDESRLSDVDTANIARIKAYEDARKAGKPHTEAAEAALAAAPMPKPPVPPMKQPQPVKSDDGASGGGACLTAAVPLQGGLALLLATLLIPRRGRS